MAYNEFLEKVKAGNLPAYGLLTWDGETGQASTSIHFELNKAEPAEVVNLRAWSFLKQLSSSEQMAVEIEITIRDHKAVRAVIRPRAGVVRLGTGRLRELCNMIQGPPGFQGS